MSPFKRLLISDRPLIMGVLNVTPDSFSDGGRYLNVEAATRHALTMIEEGADIIDIGGESTRPAGKTYGEGAQPISAEVEAERVIPVIRSILSSAPSALISLDTTKSVVAREGAQEGIAVINDVSAGTADEAMFGVAKESNLPIILMHGYGPHFERPAIEEYHYDSLIDEVKLYLKVRIGAAHDAGIEDVLADVGIGFAKTYEDNLRLIKHHAEFKSLDVPMVLGVSRKSTIGKALGGIPPEERVNGSVAAALYGVLNGAKMIRTHDVKATKEALLVQHSIVQA